MSGLTKNQKGFSAVEAILVVLIIAIVGFVGWFVWHTNQTANKNLASSSSTKSPTFKQLPKTTSTTTVVKLTKLGVELTVPNSISDLTFSVQKATTVNSEPSQSVNLSTSALAKLDSKCAADGTTPALGNLSKTNGQYPSSATVDNTSGTLVMQFSTYYIGYTSPQSACSSKTAAETTATSDLTDLKSSLSSVTAL